MSRWFRFYDDVINDPKVLKLPEATRWHWTAVLCIASKHGGKLPSLYDVGFYLRMKPKKVVELMDQLVAAGLLDLGDNCYEPHNWGGRQYQSDTSKDRVQRHRDKRAAAGLVPQWCAPAELRQSVYNADNSECVYCGSKEFLSLDHKTSELNGGSNDFDNLVTACRTCNGAKRDLSFDEYVTRNGIVTLHGRFSNASRVQNRTEQKATRVPALVFETDWPKDFRETFWKLYPRRVDKQLAFKKLEQLRRGGDLSWGTLIAGVERYALSVRGQDPKYTKGPAAWLNAGKWDDEVAEKTKPVFDVRAHLV